MIERFQVGLGNQTFSVIFDVDFDGLKLAFSIFSQALAFSPPHPLQQSLAYSLSDRRSVR